MAGTALLTMSAPVLWGTTYIVISESLPAQRPLLAAAWRVAPAGIVLIAVGLLVSRWRPHRGDWRGLIVLAIFNFGLFFPLLILAAYRLPGGVAAAAGGFQPLLVAALTGWLGRRWPARRELVIGVLAALGVALVVVRPGAGYDPVGVLAALGANVSFAVGVVLTKRFPSPPNRLAATGWQLLLGAVLLIPLTLLVEGRPPPLTMPNLVGFTYLSLLGTALAFVLWFNGIRRLPSAAPPLLGLAAPVTGAVIGWVVLQQALSALQLIGFSMTVAAIGYGALLGSHSRGQGSRGASASGVQAPVGVQELAIDPFALGRAQERDESRCVAWPSDASSRVCRGDSCHHVGTHPPGVYRAGVDYVRGDAEISELPRRSEHDPVERTLARPVRHVADDVVTGQRHDPTAAGLAAVPAGKLRDEQPRRPNVHRKVAIETLDGRIQQPRVDRLAVAEHQGRHRTE